MVNKPNKPIAAANVLAALPMAVRARLEELIKSLAKTSGHHIEAIIAFGSAVRGGFDAQRSDVDILLLLKSDAPEVLAAMAPALRLARAAARIEVVVLTTSEIARGADVFPLWFDDMRSCHSLLWGNDALADLAVHDEHKRLRVEQELREARLRLRTLVLSDVGDAILGVSLTRMTHQLRSPLHALFTLMGKLTSGKDKDDLDTVLRASADSWRIDQAALSSPQRDPRASLKAVRALLDAAVADADALAFDLQAQHAHPSRQDRGAA